MLYNVSAHNNCLHFVDVEVTQQYMNGQIRNTRFEYHFLPSTPSLQQTYFVPFWHWLNEHIEPLPTYVHMYIRTRGYDCKINLKTDTKKQALTSSWLLFNIRLSIWSCWRGFKKGSNTIDRCMLLLTANIATCQMACLCTPMHLTWCVD